MEGGGAFLLGSAVLVAVASSLTLVNYAQREVSWFAFSTSLLGFVLSFGIIALVPYDVWEALQLDDPQGKRLSASWELIYWATFLLCWVLCPLLIEYEAAGDFTMVRRLRASLRKNAAWCAGYAVLSVLLLIWLSVGGGAHGSLGAWCIAASNAWGLLVSTVLMGYGLVAVPRHLWRLASPADQLSTLYCVAVTMDEARLSTQFELQDLIGEARAEVASRSLQLWDPSLERAFAILQATLEECEMLHTELTNGARGPREGGQGCGNVPRGGEDAARLECLAQLHRALKQAGLEARRAACRWEELVNRCLLLEDLEEHHYPSAVELAAAWEGSIGRMFCRWPLARSCWHCAALLWLRTLRQRVLRILAILCGMLSALIVLGQLTMFSDRLSLSLLSFLFKESHGFVLTQFYCMVPLGYMVCTAYWSIFRLKIAGWYGLYANHNTDTGSLLWCASILARLSAPLCYHFLMLIRVQDTAFQDMMGQMNIVPVLGQGFNEVFPILVGLLCVCNLLNVYPKLVHLCGLDGLEFELASRAATDTSDLLAEGRRLVERERRRRSEDRSLLEMHERTDTESGRRSFPLRVQIGLLIEDGTLPADWMAHST